MTNLLITGATGYVSRHLLPLLKDYNVTCIVRDIVRAKNLIDEKITLIEADKLEQLEGTQVDVVLHLAAYVTSSNDTECVNKLIKFNILFGTQLLDAIHKYLTPSLFVNFGTFAEYRDGPMKIDNAYLYSATKSAFKEILRYYAELDHYKFIHIIPYTIYGGGQNSQKKVIDYVKAAGIAVEPVKMTAGEQILDFINVEDVADFLCYIINNIQRFTERQQIDYFLGTGKGTSVRELAQLYEQKYKRKCNIDWGALPYRDRDVMYAVAPISPLINVGWRPKKQLEDYI